MSGKQPTNELVCDCRLIKEDNKLYVEHTCGKKPEKEYRVTISQPAPWRKGK